MKEFNLEFEGYWLQEGISVMPTYDGIYCVYVGTLQSDGSVYLRKLIYIGNEPWGQVEGSAI